LQTYIEPSNVMNVFSYYWLFLLRWNANYNRLFR